MKIPNKWRFIAGKSIYTWAILYGYVKWPEAISLNNVLCYIAMSCSVLYHVRFISDNIGRKSRGGKRLRRARGRYKMGAHEKADKLQKTVTMIFQCFLGRCRAIWSGSQATKALRQVHFRQLRSGKSAQRCGAKGGWKWTCAKHRSSGTFGSWDVQKCMRLWREQYFEVQTSNTTASEFFWKKSVAKRVAQKERRKKSGPMHMWKSKSPKPYPVGPSDYYWNWDVYKVYAGLMQSTNWKFKCEKHTAFKPLWAFNGTTRQHYHYRTG